MRNTLRELLLSAVRLVIDVLTSPSISVVHGMVSLTEAFGVANTLASDVEKEIHFRNIHTSPVEAHANKEKCYYKYAA